MGHVPVMLDKALEYLQVHPSGIYVDGTLGGGGHSQAIAKRLNTGHLYAFDRDHAAIERGYERLRPFLDKVSIIHDNFENMSSQLHAFGVDGVDGILLDLGVSSFHFDEAARGFSYRHDAPLDMRMDVSSAFSAYELINTYSMDELTRVFKRYGEEPFARPIAKNIIKAREDAPVKTTEQLVQIIKASLPQKVLKKKGHPAKKVFQAMRIEVNDELETLKNTLKHALDLLNPNGRLVVITFHSLEDRIVKQIFKDASTVDHPKELPTMPQTTPDFNVLHRKVIVPSEREIEENPRSKSAKLRAIKRVNKN